MRRFYCTVCKRIKRVRKIPLIVKYPDAERVENRIGKCKRHQQ